MRIGSLEITFKGADIQPIVFTVGKRKPKKIKRPSSAPTVIKVREI